MKKIIYNINKNKVYYAMLFPHFLFFSLFFIIPLASCFYLSFFDYDFFHREFVFLNNFTKLFKNPLFLKALKNTAVYTLFLVPLWLGKAVIIAALLQPYRQKIQTFFKAAFYIPHVTSAVIISMIWFWIYNPSYGLLNYFLSLFGIDNISWLGNPNLALPSIIFMQFVMAGGSSIVMVSAAIASIPKSLYEAAELDGANGIQIFFRITLPLLKPIILYLLVIGVISSFQLFSNIYVMTKGGPQFSTVTIMYLIYETAFENYNFGLAAAQSIVLAVIISIISLIQFRFLGEDIEY